MISITDGQIFLETDLFYQGIRPAISVGLSVSRVGGTAQTKAVRSVSGNLRLSLAQYRELAAFAQFGSDLDKDTQASLNRGVRLTELLKQPQYQPKSVWEQTAVLLVADKGHFDDVPVDKVNDARDSLLTALASDHKKEMAELNKGDKPDDKMVALIEKVAVKVMKGFKA